MGRVRGERARDKTGGTQRAEKVEVAAGRAKDAIGARAHRKGRIRDGYRSSLAEL